MTTRTPLTLELFLKWKEDKKKQQTEAEKAAKEKRDQDIKAGKAMRSGREIFEYNPDLFKDEDDVLDTEELEPEQEEDEGPSIYIDVTGTSIRTTVVEHNEGKDEENEDDAQEKVPVEASLFTEEEIPDEEDEE